MTERETFLHQILAGPTDDTARLVWADWLEENGEQTLGRFIRAGVSVSRFLTTQPGGDTDSIQEARAEIDSISRSGAPARWLADLGLDSRLVSGVGTDCEVDDDRVTIRLGDVSAAFARGMLECLSLPLNRWYTAAGRVLAAWPLARIEITDVPGLSFEIRPPTSERGHWRLTPIRPAAERSPAQPLPDQSRLELFHALTSAVAGRPLPLPLEQPPPRACHWSDRDWSFPDRHTLVVGAAACSILFARRPPVEFPARPCERPAAGTLVLVDSLRPAPDVFWRHRAGDLELRSEFPLPARCTLIGRDEGSPDVLIRDQSVSRQHVAIVWADDGYYVMDTESRNGTALNGVRMVPREMKKLQHRDRIRVTDFHFEFRSRDRCEISLSDSSASFDTRI